MVRRRWGTSVWKGQPPGCCLLGPDLSGELREVEGHLGPILHTGSDWNKELEFVRTLHV